MLRVIDRRKTKQKSKRQGTKQLGRRGGEVQFGQTSVGIDI